MKNKFRITSIFLTGTIVLSTACTAMAETAEIFSDDFDSYDNVYDMSPKWKLKECYEYCTVRGGALHVKNRDGGAPVICMPSPKKITSGRIDITMDVLIENLGGTTQGFMVLVPESVHDYGHYRAIEFYRQKGITQIRDPYFNENYIDIKPSTWYSIKAEFYPGYDPHFTVTVYDDKGGLMGSYSRENCPDFLGNFENINFTSWTDKDFAIDNFRIVYND